MGGNSIVGWVGIGDILASIKASRRAVAPGLFWGVEEPGANARRLAKEHGPRLGILAVTRTVIGDGQVSGPIGFGHGERDFRFGQD